MTSLPQREPGAKALGLVIDLDTCVGCHACAVNCKEWNTGGHHAPLPDHQPYQQEPDGVWFNRIHSYEAGEGAAGRTINFPRSCLHCETPQCVTVCPTGASYKRAEDGIVLVNTDICIGCKLCSWACPYGAREFDEDNGVMKKCTLCIDRIYNQTLTEAEREPACVATCPSRARHFGDLADPESKVSKLVAERGGTGLMPELGYNPVNRYLPPRKRRIAAKPLEAGACGKDAEPSGMNALLSLVDRMLSAMNPSPSVLLLTTLTGAGYGLLAWLGMLDMAGASPPAPAFGIAVILIALALASAGLAASMAHLGRPERAWRAFSQWRSSWLSREGVASLLTYPPALAFAAAWYATGAASPLTRALGGLSLVMAMTTVGCTAMIYGSLIPIRQWHNRHTLPDYLIFSLFSGAALLAAIIGIWYGHATLPASLAAAAGVAAIAAKAAYWRFIDAQTPLATLASAIGVTQFGDVRPLDQPHFTENYILREMGFRIARKHSSKLRRLALAAGFILPTVFALIAAIGLAPWLFAPLAAILVLAGLYVERWLFFAEATHVSTIYYGRAA